MGALRSGGFNCDKSEAEGAFGRWLDCGSPDVLDRRGVMLFEMQDGVHRLVETVAITETAKAAYQAIIPALVDEDIRAFAYDEDTPIHS